MECASAALRTSSKAFCSMLRACTIASSRKLSACLRISCCLCRAPFTSSSSTSSANFERSSSCTLLPYSLSSAAALCAAAAAVPASWLSGWSTTTPYADAASDTSPTDSSEARSCVSPAPKSCLWLSACHGVFGSREANSVRTCATVACATTAAASAVASAAVFCTSRSASCAICFPSRCARSLTLNFSIPTVASSRATSRRSTSRSMAAHASRACCSAIARAWMCSAAAPCLRAWRWEILVESW
mmetsp:Transcript_40774/g.77847  ORF Transcript_40774/g.77847 Transcript_40774/m.77847 type:complete len:245 (+) Transcript_40774:401-1135(+)